MEKQRILIIDDDPSYAKMVREWIKDIYKVDVLTAGKMAITFLERAMQKAPVNLILLDYEMPEINGPEVLQLLKQNPSTADIPVYFLTGANSPEIVDQIRSSKAEGYLVKTTTRTELISFLEEKL